MSRREDYEAELFQDRAEARKRAADAEHKAQQLQAELDALKAAHAWIKTSERVPEETCDVLGVVDGVVMPLNYAKEGIMSEWTTQEPEARRTYWLSIAPDKRPASHGPPFPSVIKCHVDLLSPGFQWVVDGIEPTKHVRYGDRGDWLPLDQDWFKGAQWKLVDPDPADPFAEPPPNNSRDSDLP